MGIQLIINGETHEEVKAHLAGMAGMLLKVDENQVYPVATPNSHVIENDGGAGEGPKGSDGPAEQPSNDTPNIEKNPANDKLEQTDADGYLWDQRIHAKTKTMTKDGRWKKGRNLTPELIAEVEAELAKIRDANPLKASNETTPQAEEPANPAPLPPTQAQNPAPLPPTQQQPTVPTPPVAGDPAPNSEAPADFPSLLQIVNEREIDQETLDNVAAAIGLNKYMNLAARNDMIPAFWEALCNAI